MMKIISRHAGAGKVLIQLIIHRSNLTLIVEDNGKGFQLEEALQAPSLGLKNIQARVDYLNGQLNIDSVPGEGTAITIELPSFSQGWLLALLSNFFFLSALFFISVFYLHPEPEKLSYEHRSRPRWQYPPGRAGNHH